MHDSGARGNHLELVEGILAPAKELVALAIAFVLELHVTGLRVGRSEKVGDDGMVDDQFSGCQRLDDVGIASQSDHCLTHRCQVHDHGNTGEVLHHYSRRGELDLPCRLCARIPVAKRSNRFDGGVGAIFRSKQVL